MKHCIITEIPVKDKDFITEEKIFNGLTLHMERQNELDLGKGNVILCHTTFKNFQNKMFVIDFIEKS